MVDTSSILATVNIRPESDVYATYQRLSYKPWFALAEFVDNSTQNYYDHRERLLREFQRVRPTAKLVIDIDYDGDSNSLTILDNANGMEIEELTRALVLNRPPPDTSGRSEFGMGLKTAACWFGETWTIETSRLDSVRRLRAQIHVPELVANKTEEIPVSWEPAEPSEHYTKITIEGLHNPIRGRTPSRIRDQLASIYRRDINSGEIEIRWNTETISFRRPPILEETSADGHVTRWTKPLSFNVAVDGFTQSLPVNGWVGIRIPASQRDAGFVLLRKGRVIVGGPGEGYKPTDIFGQGNTFRSQRLIGELDLNEWPVTQAKDAFDWSGGLEDAFIDKLRDCIQEYIDKAEGHRANPSVSNADMQLAGESTKRFFEDPEFAAGIASALDEPRDIPSQVSEPEIQTEGANEGPLVYRLNLGAETWEFRLFWQDSQSDAQWMQIHYPSDDQIDIYLNAVHPFFADQSMNRSAITLIHRFVLALALAEKMAQRISTNDLVAPADFRLFMNKILRRASEIVQYE